MGVGWESLRSSHHHHHGQCRYQSDEKLSIQTVTKELHFSVRLNSKYFSVRLNSKCFSVRLNSKCFSVITAKVE